MKIVTILFILTLNSITLPEVRVAYKEAIESKEKAEILYAELAKVKKEKVVLNGYKAATEVLLSKFSKQGEKRKERLKKGVGLLEDLILNNQDNVELRFLRLGIQENLPKFLKYNKNITEDKQLIIQQYPKLNDKHLKQVLKEYVLQSKVFTNEEKNVFSEQ